MIFRRQARATHENRNATLYRVEEIDAAA